MKIQSAALMALLLIVSSTVPIGAAAATTQQGEAYVGTHVEFETASDAIVDYTVNGETMLQSVQVQSQSTAESRGDVRAGVGLSAVTELTGAALSLDSQTEVSATITAESGATMHAHDNSKGILVVRSGGESQYVTVNVSSSSQAENEGEKRVIVTTEDGTKGAFIVVGDGEVTVNEQGDVSANVGSDGTLVFRSYPEGRDDNDQQEEQLISEGKAAAEVYVMESSEEGRELAADVVQYSEDTTVEVTQKTEGTVTMTAERSQEQGKIIITSVSEQAISSVENLQVTVDGEAAAEASSYSELESAINNGDSSKFLVRQQSSAQASADVLVAVNHFSTREITMSEDGSGSDGSDGTEADGTDGSDGDGDQTTTDGQGPGFGPVVTLIALVAVAALALARRR
ncbi:PGF-CTERM sorting domain-containing protein [Haloarcula sp. JP-L23]|uniref:PGF-CTERM sorting domain-containing protein n=1 Tax=Haloarcula sp. JP-L23 TaxID=2716717 RepID=UPI00140ECFC5|nr:PGF-CTERM sorting domain-containing protein [Haloarcula sp. JP-L23]